MPVDFDKQEYWSERFTHEQTFEWLMPWSVLEPWMHQLHLLPKPCHSIAAASSCPDTTKSTQDEPMSISTTTKSTYTSAPFQILNLGCGNSDLPLDLYKAGYPNVLSVDFVGSVVERLKDRCEQAIGWTSSECTGRSGLQENIPEPGPCASSLSSAATNALAVDTTTTTEMAHSGNANNNNNNSSNNNKCPLQFQEMDCLDMSSLPSNHFHLCIDKSTSDAISCGDDDQYTKLRTLCEQVARVIKQPGGVWCVVSYSRFRQYEWDQGLGMGLWKTEGIHEIKVEARPPPPPTTLLTPSDASSELPVSSTPSKIGRRGRKETQQQKHQLQQQQHTVHVPDVFQYLYVNRRL